MAPLPKGGWHGNSRDWGILFLGISCENVDKTAPKVVKYL